MEDGRRNSILAEIKSGSITSVGDYIVSEWLGRGVVPTEFVRWQNIPNAIYIVVAEPRDYLIELHQLRQLLEFLVRNEFAISSSIGDGRNFYFLDLQRLNTFRNGDPRGVGDFVVGELYDFFQKSKDARYIATNELTSYINNNYQTSEEVSEKFRRDELEEEKRRNRKNERTTKVLAFSSLFISFVATIISVINLVTYSTSRDVLVKNLQQIPIPIEVRIVGNTDKLIVLPDNKAVKK